MFQKLSLAKLLAYLIGIVYASGVAIARGITLEPMVLLGGLVIYTLLFAVTFRFTK